MANFNNLNTGLDFIKNVILRNNNLKVHLSSKPNDAKSKNIHSPNSVKEGSQNGK
jgi:hypothetical protein